MVEFHLVQRDLLVLRTRGSVARVITCLVTVLFRDGSLRDFPLQHNSSTGRTVNTSQTGAMPLDGIVVGVNIQNAAGLKRGAVLAEAFIAGPAGFARQFLCRAYVYDGRFVGLGEFEDPLSGRGLIRSITGTNPAAGVEISETVPTNARWRPLSVDTINAIGAASINASLTITDGTTQKWRSALIATGTGTELIVWAQGVTLNEADLFSTVPLLAGDIAEAFELVTAGISADDDYAAPQLLVEEWIEP